MDDRDYWKVEAEEDRACWKQAMEGAIHWHKAYDDLKKDLSDEALANKAILFENAQLSDQCDRWKCKLEYWQEQAKTLEWALRSSLALKCYTCIRHDVAEDECEDCATDDNWKFDEDRFRRDKTI